MADLTIREFIQDRIDEKKHAAEMLGGITGSRTWTVRERPVPASAHVNVMLESEPDWCLVEACCGSLDDRRAVAAFVAAHSPAQVLAEVAAKRAILDLHSIEDGSPAQLSNGHWEGYGSNERWIRDRDDKCPTCHVLEPCDTILALAQSFAGHPDFSEDWRQP